MEVVYHYTIAHYKIPDNCFVMRIHFELRKHRFATGIRATSVPYRIRRHLYLRPYSFWKCGDMRKTLFNAHLVPFHP
jgi:hypothetical protein